MQSIAAPDYIRRLDLEAVALLVQNLKNDISRFATSKAKRPSEEVPVNNSKLRARHRVILELYDLAGRF
jgi:hypothetical protein